MEEKIPCLNCGTPILPRTAKQTDGLCRPCDGARESSAIAVSQGILQGMWSSIQDVYTLKYLCGFCDKHVASGKGWETSAHGARSRDVGALRICPLCNQPTYFGRGIQVPGSRPGAVIEHLAADVAALYEEARECFAAGAFTGCVMLLRKLLMHVAVEKGQKPGLGFVAYVEYLNQQGYLGKDGKRWVDLIRKGGNEANHEILLVNREDAMQLLSFAEMLLKLIYEFPGKLPQS